MKNFQLIASGVDVTQLILGYKRRPDIWREDTYLRDYKQGPFKDLESIMLRFPEKTVHETEEALKEHAATHDLQDCINYPGWWQFPEAQKFVRSVMNLVEGERIGRVFLNRLRAGGKIYPHADHPFHAGYWRRFHLVCESEPGVEFRCGDETIHMEPGQVWYFNNALEHEVLNNSASDRVHLVMDFRLPI